MSPLFALAVLSMLLVLGPPAALSWATHAFAQWSAKGAELRAARARHEARPVTCRKGRED